MGDNRDSYLVKALLDNYEEPLDISLISNNPFIPSIGNNLNTPTNQNNEKRHLLPESTPNLPPNLNNKTPAKSKSIQELESFIDQKCNELAQGSLKRDAEIKQQISDELEAHYNTSLVKSLKDQIDILQSEVYFLREELREKNNLFKILMKSKTSDNKCHNIDTNNQNDKIPESAPSELRHTTTNKNNHKNISKNENDEKINENMVQINNKFSSERDVIAGVPQGSIDGPLLFNLFINDLVFFIEQCTLSNYADDNNLSISGEDKELIKSMLSSDFMIVENWFFENYMILNPGKCYFMCIGKNVNDSESLNLNGLNLKNCKEVEVLGITIDRNLNFKGHIKNISRKAGQKLSALLRISSHINTDKKSLLYKSIIKSQFAYCPLVWMFCFRERALKLIYQENSNFEALLEKQHDFSIHQRNLQVLMTEIYKIVNGIAPPIINSLFTFRLNQHNLRNFQELLTEKRNTVNYGLETVTYRAPIIWAKLPSEYKLAGSLTAFKSKIKSWKCAICTCRLCKKYEPSLGYI